MPSLQTTFKSGWITALVLPAPTGIQSPQDVLDAGLSTALEMVSDAHFMAHLNPLVQKCEVIPPSHPKAVDHTALATAFKVPATHENTIEGEEGEWRHYAITDKLALFPGYTTDLTYYS